MNPTELLDQFVKDWNSELGALAKSVELESISKDDKRIVLISRFINQLELIKPYMWNSLAYDENHKKEQGSSD